MKLTIYFSDGSYDVENCRTVDDAINKVTSEPDADKAVVEGSVGGMDRVLARYDSRNGWQLK